MIHSVGIVEIVVDADAVDVTGRIDLPSAARIIRARRFTPVGTFDTPTAVDETTRLHMTRIVAVGVETRRS